MVCMYSSNSAVVPVHIINMSSMNLFHVCVDVVWG